MKNLEWKIILNDTFNFRDDEEKRIRMSEMLIYPEINPKYIEKIIVPTYQMKSEIENHIKELEIEKIVIIKDKEIFKKIYYNF